MNRRLQPIHRLVFRTILRRGRPLMPATAQQPVDFLPQHHQVESRSVATSLSRSSSMGMGRRPGEQQLELLMATSRVLPCPPHSFSSPTRRVQIAAIGCRWMSTSEPATTVP